MSTDDNTNNQKPNDQSDLAIMIKTSINGFIETFGRLDTFSVEQTEITTTGAPCEKEPILHQYTQFRQEANLKEKQEKDRAQQEFVDTVLELSKIKGHPKK